jgi:hypothetical protein
LSSNQIRSPYARLLLTWILFPVGPGKLEDFGSRLATIWILTIWACLDPPSTARRRSKTTKKKVASQNQVDQERD